MKISFLSLCFNLVVAATAFLWVVAGAAQVPPPGPGLSHGTWLRKSDVMAVLNDDPAKPIQFGGKVVVLVTWGVVVSDELAEDTKAKREAETKRKRLANNSRPLIREFDRMRKRFEGNPDVVFVGRCGVTPEYTEAAVMALAKELGFTAPILQVKPRSEGDFSSSDAEETLGVMLFDARGYRRYQGSFSPSFDDALRVALRDQAKK